ncbi:MAG TPA: thermonuclease family protein [Myxococcota bacterium]|jgi:micrococcal nuclease
MSQRRLLRLAVLLAVAVIAHFYLRRDGAAPAVASAQREAVRLGPCDVTRVVDGDTLTVRCAGRKERVRMLQIDTPEREQPLYLQAGDALELAIAGRRVELELGPEPRDDYGRLLAYVFADGENLNLRMIRDGWSPYFDRYGAGAYPREFADAERAAREAARGIWRARR